MILTLIKRISISAIFMLFASISHADLALNIPSAIAKAQETIDNQVNNFRRETKEALAQTTLALENEKTKGFWSKLFSDHKENLDYMLGVEKSLYEEAENLGDRIEFLTSADLDSKTDSKSGTYKRPPDTYFLLSNQLAAIYRILQHADVNSSRFKDLAEKGLNKLTYFENINDIFKKLIASFEEVIKYEKQANRPEKVMLLGNIKDRLKNIDKNILKIINSFK